MYIQTFPNDCIQKETDGYTIVKYPPSKKNMVPYCNFRSVIYNSEKNPVCFSPPKSISMEQFKSSFPIDQCIIEQFVEGTMINVFYDETWKIATKSVLHATCTFNSERTFSKMFYDCNLQLDALDQSMVYSFVMQHPDNRIVTKINVPRLVLVASYQIQNGYAIEVNVEGFNKPTQYVYSSYEDAEHAAQLMDIKGIVFKCNGVRSKIRNSDHEMIEKIKGNSPFRVHYLWIRNTEKAKEYFSHFPEDHSLATQIESTITTSAKQLLRYYKQYFIYKNSVPIKKQFLFDLHQIYLTKLKPKFMNLTETLHYMNQLHPSTLMYLLQELKTSQTNQ
jgi:hypothetical protein